MLKILNKYFAVCGTCQKTLWRKGLDKEPFCHLGIAYSLEAVYDGLWDFLRGTIKNF